MKLPLTQGSLHPTLKVSGSASFGELRVNQTGIARLSHLLSEPNRAHQPRSIMRKGQLRLAVHPMTITTTLLIRFLMLARLTSAGPEKTNG